MRCHEYSKASCQQRRSCRMEASTSTITRYVKCALSGRQPLILYPHTRHGSTASSKARTKSYYMYSNDYVHQNWGRMAKETNRQVPHRGTGRTTLTTPSKSLIHDSSPHLNSHPKNCCLDSSLTPRQLWSTPPQNQPQPTTWQRKWPMSLNRGWMDMQRWSLMRSNGNLR